MHQHVLGIEVRMVEAGAMQVRQSLTELPREALPL